MESCVRGFHVYKDIWIPATGEVLSCKGEDGNIMDPNAIAIMKGSEIIGHVPRKISAACYLFIQKGGVLTCIITDSNHQYSSDLPQGGLQIPCKLVFESHDVELMAKVRKLLQSAPPIYVQLEQPVSKRKLEPLYKAKAEPAKKKERKDDSPIVILVKPLI